jgi:hypothetical protein
VLRDVIASMDGKNHRRSSSLACKGMVRESTEGRVGICHSRPSGMSCFRSVQGPVGADSNQDTNHMINWSRTRRSDDLYKLNILDRGSNPRLFGCFPIGGGDPRVLGETVRDPPTRSRWKDRSTYGLTRSGG